MVNFTHPARIQGGTGEVVDTRTTITAADLLAARMFLANYQVNGRVISRWDGVSSRLPKQQYLLQMGATGSDSQQPW